MFARLICVFPNSTTSRSNAVMGCNQSPSLNMCVDTRPLSGNKPLSAQTLHSEAPCNWCGNNCCPKYGLACLLRVKPLRSWLSLFNRRDGGWRGEGGGREGCRLVVGKRQIGRINKEFSCLVVWFFFSPRGGNH